MSHSIRAQIWYDFIDQLDASHVLREIVASFELSSAIANPAQKNYLFYEFLVRLQVVFDAQRVLCKNSELLVNPDLLLATIFRIINDRLDRPPDAEDYQKDDTFNKHSPIFAVLLSGLRALVLRRCVLNNERRLELEAKLHKLTNYSRVSTANQLQSKYVELCLRAVKELSTEQSSLEGLQQSYASHDTFPDWKIWGLQPEVLAEKFVQCLSEKKLEHCGQYFWISYDIAGVIETAYTASCNGCEAATRERLHLLREVKNRMISRMSKLSEGDAEITILKDVLTRWCGLSCTCYGTITQDHYDSDDSYNTSASSLKELNRMLSYLRCRREELTGGETRLRRLPERLFEKIQQWRGDEKLGGYDSFLDLDSNENHVTYVVNCPEMHALPASFLLRRTDPTEACFQDLVDKKILVRFLPPKSCPHCQHPQPSFNLASRVVPLGDFLSELVSEQKSAWKGLPRALLAEPCPSSSTPESSGDSISNRISDSSRPSTYFNTEPGFQQQKNAKPLPRSTKEMTQLLNTTVRRRSTFSADGETLLLWDYNEDNIVVARMSFLTACEKGSQRFPKANYYIRPSRLEVSKVLDVCAGAQRISCISEHAFEGIDHESRVLTIFDVETLKKSFTTILPTSPKITVMACDISSDDRHFATILGNSLYLYDIENSMESNHMPSIISIPLEEYIIHSHNVRFSADSKTLTIGSRCTHQETTKHSERILMYGLNVRSKEPILKKFVKVTELAKLVCILSFPKYSKAFLGVFNDIKCSVVYPFIGSQSYHNQWDKFYRTQSAASSPNERNVIILTEDNTVHMLDISQPSPKGKQLGKFKMAYSRPQEVALGVPAGHDIRVFWDDKKHYHIFQVDESGNSFQGIVDISEYDRVGRPRTSTLEGIT